MLQTIASLSGFDVIVFTDTSRALGLYPGARRIVLLAYPYAPFHPDERVPAYYLASDKCYKATGKLVDELRGMGFYAERASKLPLQETFLASGVGVRGRNGLLRISPYGSRIVLSAIATDMEAPCGSVRDAEAPCPPGCNRCVDACPAHCIGEQPAFARCRRSLMDTALHPEQIRREQRMFLGCDECMNACPFNAVLQVAAPSEEALKAFALEKLIRGDAAAARALVGRNMSSNGKLTAEAICFAARDGVLYDEIRDAAVSSPFPAVREAASWALEKYFSTHDMESK